MLKIDARAIRDGSSVAITLPKFWRDANDVKSGDAVILEIAEDSLTIRPKKSARPGN